MSGFKYRKIGSTVAYDKLFCNGGAFFLDELRQNRSATLEELTDGISTQIWEMTDERTYGYANAAHAAFLGKSRKQIEQQDIYSLLPGSVADLCALHNHKVFEIKKPLVSEEWALDAEGKRRLLRITRSPVLDDAGQVRFLCCSAEDLTQQNFSGPNPTEDGLPVTSEHLEEIVHERVNEMVDSLWGTVSSLVHRAESQDEKASGHLRRLEETCRVVASILSFNSVYSQQLNYGFIQNLQQACLLHDIGKTGIPDSILLKPGKLTREEFEVMKQHTTIGAQTLEQVYPSFQSNSILKMAIDIALYHHERWDGKGYPKGLKGDEIPLAAQIVAICDVYDAIRSVRPYKPAYSHEESLSEIRRECGTHFNPALCDAFFNCAEEIRHIYESYSLT
jgi:HD-GYP domain-containing protein (c-di-GMP phosphodiesterase class II)